jgi:hypothetical protein
VNHARGLLLGGSAALALAIGGCGDKYREPDAPPPGAEARIPPRTASAATAASALTPEIHPRWIGTRHWTERETAIDALRRIGPQALPNLVELLHGPDPIERELSARAIALMGPEAKAAVPDLVAALSDSDPDVRKNVMRAIGQMGPDAASAIPVLVQEVHRPSLPKVETPNKTDNQRVTPGGTQPGPTSPR